MRPAAAVKCLPLPVEAIDREGGHCAKRKIFSVGGFLVVEGLSVHNRVNIRQRRQRTDLRLIDKLPSANLQPSLAPSNPSTHPYPNLARLGSRSTLRLASLVSLIHLTTITHTSTPSRPFLFHDHVNLSFSLVDTVCFTRI